MKAGFIALALSLVIVASGAAAAQAGDAATESDCPKGDINCHHKSSSSVPDKNRIEGSTKRKQSRETKPATKSPDRSDKQ